MTSCTLNWNFHNRVHACIDIIHGTGLETASKREQPVLAAETKACIVAIEGKHRHRDESTAPCKSASTMEELLRAGKHLAVYRGGTGLAIGISVQFARKEL